MPGRAPYPRKESEYRQSYPPFESSVEEGTPLVPSDGRFYVIDRSRIDQGFATLRRAPQLYQQLKTGQAAQTDGESA